MIGTSADIGGNNNGFVWNLRAVVKKHIVIPTLKMGMCGEPHLYSKTSGAFGAEQKMGLQPPVI